MHYHRMDDEDQRTINGLLRKRADLEKQNAECRERMAVIANDIEAIDRVLDAFGYQGPLEGRTPRAARIILQERASPVPTGRIGARWAAYVHPRACADHLPD